MLKFKLNGVYSFYDFLSRSEFLKILIEDHRKEVLGKTDGLRKSL